MANFTEQFTLKVTKEQKEFTKDNKKDLFRDLLNIAMKYTDNDLKDLSIQIVILENEINDLQDCLNKNLTDIDYYNQKIQEKTDINNKYTDMISEKNIQIRELLDMQEKQEKEYEGMYNKILKLIEDNNCDELTVQEVLENQKYCTTNNIIEYITAKLDDKKYIDILKTCKR